MELKFEYNRNLYLKTLFEGNVVYFETALPLGKEEITLLYPIKEIITVTNYALDKKYKEGKDFIVKDGKLIILEDGDIPISKIEDYYVDEPGQYQVAVNKDKALYKFDKTKYIVVGDNDDFAKQQIAICYKHDGVWDGFRNVSQKEKLVHFLSKLEKKQETTVVFYGDSITTGCNSSGTIYGGNKPPYAESFPEMVARYLEDKYKTKVNYVNTAVEGMDSNWAKDNYVERVSKYKPDVLFLAFGMNDGHMNEEDQLTKMLEIIKGVKKDNPSLEVVLISTTVPNIETDWYVFGNQERFIEAYKTVDLPYVAICDMTHVHLDLLKRKRFKDMTGNNVNHPNDFLARVYAQAILEVMGEVIK